MPDKDTLLTIMRESYDDRGRLIDELAGEIVDLQKVIAQQRAEIERLNRN